MDPTFSNLIDHNLEWIEFYLTSIDTALSGPDFFKFYWSQSWFVLFSCCLFWYSLEWSRLFQTLLIPISSWIKLLKVFCIQSRRDCKFMGQSSIGSREWPSQYRSTWIRHGLVKTDHRKFGIFTKKSSLSIPVHMDLDLNLGEKQSNPSPWIFHPIKNNICPVLMFIFCLRSNLCIVYVTKNCLILVSIQVGFKISLAH